MIVVRHNHSDIINDDNPIVIYAFGDTHIGNVGFDEKLLKKHINMCKKENAYWIHLGDWCEAISSSDKRFDIRSNDTTILAQYMKAIELFKPIKEKCLGILSGNHDEKIATKYGDFVGMVASTLNIPYLGYGGFINLGIWHQEGQRRPNYNVVIMIHHGHGSGATVGSNINNLTKLSHKYEANMYIFGHNHKFMLHQDYKIEIKGKGMKKKNRYYIQCPAYLNAYDNDKSSYVKRAALQPNPIGCVRIELNRKGSEIFPKITPILE